MDCPYCGSATKVIFSRSEVDLVHRRRSCLNCNFRYNTVEIDCDLYKSLNDASSKNNRKDEGNGKRNTGRKNP